MALFTQDNSLKARLVEKENIFGQTENTMKVLGLKIKCMDLESLSGLTKKCMKVLLSWIKEKDMELSFGKMVESTLENGRMENSTELVYTLVPMAKQGKECG